MNPTQTFFELALQQPQKPAIANPQFEMSYADAADTVRRIAQKLRSHGVQQSTVVALKLRPELETLFTIAVMQLGAVSLHATKIVLREYGKFVNVCVTDDPTLLQAGVATTLVDEDYIQSLAALRPLAEIAQWDVTATCRIVFSSGTTGTPKGVPFSVDYLLERLDSAEKNWIPARPFMSLLGLDTVTGFQTFLWALLRGETYFTTSEAAAHVQTISQYEIAAIKTSPARLNELLAEAEHSSKALSALNVIQVAGSLMNARTITRCQTLLGITPVYLYGSTEVGTVSRGAARLDDPRYVGNIVADAEAEISDETNSSVAGKVAGPLRFRKSHMPSQYWNDPAPNPAKGFHDGWFHPGDVATITKEGELLLDGRSDDLVNAGGTKFTLQQLDLWLQNIDLFDDAASAQFTSEDGDTQIVVAFESQHEIGREAVLTAIESFLPGIPVVLISRVREIPRNQLGKVDRRTLLNQLPIN